MSYLELGKLKVEQNYAHESLAQIQSDDAGYDMDDPSDRLQRERDIKSACDHIVRLEKKILQLEIKIREDERNQK